MGHLAVEGEKFGREQPEFGNKIADSYSWLREEKTGANQRYDRGGMHRVALGTEVVLETGLPDA
jgi:hypothetical protein